MTFEGYQTHTNQVPLSLRNNRQRIELPGTGLQEEAGKLDSLLTKAFSSGEFTLPQKQAGEIKNRLADVLWYLALLCRETGIPMQDLAVHSLTQQATHSGIRRRISPR
jgi:NTP pyrophosphatase (non-canonical NTP hydrolase)